jgi:hypothetical protein
VGIGQVLTPIPPRKLPVFGEVDDNTGLIFNEYWDQKQGISMDGGDTFKLSLDITFQYIEKSVRFILSLLRSRRMLIT